MTILGLQLDRLLPGWFVLSIIAAVIIAPYVIGDHQQGTLEQATSTGEQRARSTIHYTFTADGLRASHAER